MRNFIRGIKLAHQEKKHVEAMAQVVSDELTAAGVEGELHESAFNVLLPFFSEYKDAEDAKKHVNVLKAYLPEENNEGLGYK